MRSKSYSMRQCKCCREWFRPTHGNQEYAEGHRVPYWNNKRLRSVEAVERQRKRDREIAKSLDAAEKLLKKARFQLDADGDFVDTLKGEDHGK